MTNERNVAATIAFLTIVSFHNFIQPRSRAIAECDVWDQMIESYIKAKIQLISLIFELITFLRVR